MLVVIMLSVLVASNFTEKKFKFTKNVYTIERWRSSQQTYNLFHIQDTHATFHQGILTERKGSANTAKLLLVFFQYKLYRYLAQVSSLAKESPRGPILEHFLQP